MATTFQLDLHNDTSQDFTLAYETPEERWATAPPHELKANSSATCEAETDQPAFPFVMISLIYETGSSAVSISAIGNDSQYGPPTQLGAIAAGAGGFQAISSLTSSTNPYAGEVTIE